MRINEVFTEETISRPSLTIQPLFYVAFCKQINTSSKSCYSARCGTGHLPYKLLSHRSVKRIACRTMTMRARRTVVLEEYRKHVAERAAEGLRPNPGCKPNGRTCRAAEKPARGRRRIPVRSVNQPCSPGVDEAAYVKAGFLAAIAKGEAKSLC